MEPTNAEQANIVTMAALLDWADVSDTPYATPVVALSTASPRSEFLTHIGLGPSHHYRLLGILPTKDFELGIGSLEMNGVPMTLGARGSLLLAHATARCMCKLDPWPSMAAPSTFTLGPAPPLLSNPGVGAPGLVNTPTIKLGKIIDQASPAEITYLPHPEFQKMYDTYVRVMQEPPAEEIAATVEQLSGMKHVLESGRAPFADFSIFGPHGTRTFKKVNLCGLTMDSAGNFQQVELFGPPTVEAWMASYDVLSTTLIMLDAVSRPRLAAYRKKIERYASQYGASVWHLLYQADVRCRQEHMEALNYRLAAAHTAAMSFVPPHASSYDPAKPWDAVWAETLGREDQDWWSKEFETPAILIITRTSKLGDSIGGDAPISAGLNVGAGSSGDHQRRPAPQPHAPGGGARKTKKGHKKQSVGPQVSGEHGMKTNRTGKPLCSDFQHGNCDQAGSQNSCPRHSGQVHQCSRCLDPRHGAFGPNKKCTEKQSTASTRQGKGRGKGKK